MVNLSNTQAGKVQIELSSRMLIQLLQSGILHGNDCKCLNANAKKTLWQALLASSANNEEFQGNNAFA